MDNVMSKAELIRKLHELNFYAVELNLFLDTHPNDSKALQDYKRVLDSLEQLRKIYNQTSGSFMNFGHGYVKGNYWDWVSPDEQWPWENRRL